MTELVQDLIWLNNLSLDHPVIWRNNLLLRVVEHYRVLLAVFNTALVAIAFFFDIRLLLSWLFGFRLSRIARTCRGRVLLILEEDELPCGLRLHISMSSRSLLVVSDSDHRIGFNTSSSRFDPSMLDIQGLKGFLPLILGL